MIEKRKPIHVSDAIKRVMKHAYKGPIQHVPIEKSNGRFLGEDLKADHHVPPFDRSSYDGFAVRSIDTKEASSVQPVYLKVIGEIGAGTVWETTVCSREAVRIMTGAQMPEGSDAVIMLEAVKEIADKNQNTIQIRRCMQMGDNISFMGEDTKKGTVIVEKGTYITPGIVACLATFGYKYVPVSQKPKIGIISTGSELLELDEPIEPGKIRNSNAYMIQSQVIRAGGEPIYFGQLSDDIETCYEQVKSSLDKVDILITTGGVSVGDYDYLPDIYKRLEADVLFNKIAMRPGSVTTVAQKNGKLLFGLSGNPSSCFVGFELYTRPVIRTFLNVGKSFPKKTVATLSTDFPGGNPYDRFVRGYLSYCDGQLVATPIGLDKSNIVSSLATANVLIEFPRGPKDYEAGSQIPVILLEDQEGVTKNSFINFNVKEATTQ